VRTYPVKLGANDGMPTSLFDPRWREPEVAARVAFTLYCRNDFANARAPLARELEAQRADLTETRTFALAHVHSIERDGAKRFKGGSYGELHRHYALGGSNAGGALNFHAQAVSFGVDDAGRYCLNANVGRFDGPWGNDALLTVTFFARGAALGAVRWHASLDPVGDKRVCVVGRDAVIAEQFEAIDRADVAFTARHGKDAAPPEEARTSPKLSRARRSVLTKELTRIVALADKSARGAALKKLLDGMSEEDVRTLAKEAGVPFDAVHPLLS
jgi:hypothetical protein